MMNSLFGTGAGNLDIDEMVKKIDKRIAELEEEERRNQQEKKAQPGPARMDEIVPPRPERPPVAPPLFEKPPVAPKPVAKEEPLPPPIPKEELVQQEEKPLPFFQLPPEQESEKEEVKPAPQPKTEQFTIEKIVREPKQAIVHEENVPSLSIPDEEEDDKFFDDFFDEDEI